VLTRAGPAGDGEEGRVDGFADCPTADGAADEEETGEEDEDTSAVMDMVVDGTGESVDVSDGSGSAGEADGVAAGDTLVVWTGDVGAVVTDEDVGEADPPVGADGVCVGDMEAVDESVGVCGILVVTGEGSTMTVTDGEGVGTTGEASVRPQVSSMAVRAERSDSSVSHKPYALFTSIQRIE